MDSGKASRHRLASRAEKFEKSDSVTVETQGWRWCCRGKGSAAGNGLRYGREGELREAMGAVGEERRSDGAKIAIDFGDHGLGCTRGMYGTSHNCVLRRAVR